MCGRAWVASFRGMLPAVLVVDAIAGRTTTGAAGGDRGRAPPRSGGRGVWGEGIITCVCERAAWQETGRGVRKRRGGAAAGVGPGGIQCPALPACVPFPATTFSPLVASQSIEYERTNERSHLHLTTTTTKERKRKKEDAKRSGDHDRKGQPSTQDDAAARKEARKKERRRTCTLSQNDYVVVSRFLFPWRGLSRPGA